MKTPLREAREKSGLLQSQLAKAVKRPIRTYQRYESGERVPDVHTAQRLAIVLEATVDKLFPLPEREDAACL